MHSFKSYLLILAIYLANASLMFGQGTGTSCGAAITPPATSPVCYGTSLAATPTGTGFTYQWLKDGVRVPNATRATLPVQGSGNYAVIVRGTACTVDTSDAVNVQVTEQEAKFNADDKTRMSPPSPAPLCGVPVRIALKNESTGATAYKWEVTNSNGDPAPATQVLFIENTTATSENPVLQFNEKGQYTVKLTITGPCNPNGEEGPDDPVDPENPDAELDGRYVHEETVIIVYPQVNPQPNEFCVNPSAGPTVVLSGSQLATFDANITTVKKNFLWAVKQGPGVTISDATIENPNITFPNAPGTYVLTVRFENDCEASDVLSGITEITVTFNPLPPKPNLTDTVAFVCEGEPYTIEPNGSGSNSNKLYNFYEAGRLLNTTGPEGLYTLGSVTRQRVIEISAVENNCESTERAKFTVNVISQNVVNTINTVPPTTYCANTKPRDLIGNTVQAVGTNRPRYTWKSSVDGSGFLPAEGTNNQVNYTFPNPLASGIYTFVREVTFEGCDIPSISNEITIEVLPEFDVTTNTIATENGQTRADSVCRGQVLSFTGSPLGDDFEYRWESSTTNQPNSWITAVGTDSTKASGFKPRFISQKIFYRRSVRQKNSSCGWNPSAAIEISIVELPETPRLKAPPTVCKSTSAVLEVDAPNADFNYRWYNSTAPGATPIGSGPQFTTPDTLTVSTVFFVEAVNKNDCVSSGKAAISVTIRPCIGVVNTFSPNGDGINDVWVLENIENYPEATVEIFNRYGAQVYKSTGYTQPWDGKHNGTVLPLATYYYIIRLTKNVEPLTGSITIIK